MIQFSTEHIRKKLRYEILNRTYDLRNDEVMEEVVLDLIRWDEEECYPLYQIDNWISQLFDFDFEWVDIPSEVGQEEYEVYQYRIFCAFCIPELIPYSKKSKYDKFFEDVDSGSYSSGAGYNIEMVYLPTSTFANSNEPAYSQFGNQPGTFIIAAQDEGCMEIEDVAEFLDKLRTFNYKIIDFLNGEERKTK